MSVDIIPPKMDLLVNNHPNVRYEALFRLSKAISNVSEIDSLGKVLGKHLKYVLNFHKWDCLIPFDDDYLRFYGDKRKIQVTKLKSSDLFKIERQVFDDGLPIEFKCEQYNVADVSDYFSEQGTYAPSIYVLPGLIERKPNQRVLLAFCSKEKRIDKQDIKFSHFVIDLIGIKVMQLSAEKSKRQIHEQLQRSKKLEAIGQLAAGIAHEINTPCQFLYHNLGFLQDSWFELVQLLKKCEQLKKLDSSQAQSSLSELLKYIEAVDIEYLNDEIPAAIKQSIEGIQHISQIIAGMKAFTQPSGNNRAAIDINELIKEVLIVSANEWKSVANVETELAEDLPHIIGIQSEISQAVIHLLINAVHAIEGCSYNEDKGLIKIITRSIEDNIEIIINDNGCGIDEENLAKVFDMFFTTKEVGKGAGQGLAIAYAIVVEKHHGVISIDSKVDQGTTFTVKLPINLKLSTYPQS